MICGAIVPPPVYQRGAGQSLLAQSIDVQQPEIWRRIEHEGLTIVVGKKDLPSHGDWRSRKVFPSGPTQLQLPDEFAGLGVMT